jgi:hypothetical protein
MAKKKAEVKQVKTINIIVKTPIRQQLTKNEAIEDYDNFVKEFTVLNIHNKSKAITLLKSKRDTAMERYQHYGKLLGIDTTSEYNKHGYFELITTYHEDEQDNKWDKKKANNGHFAYWQEMAERLNKFWFMLKPEEKINSQKVEDLNSIFNHGKFENLKTILQSLGIIDVKGIKKDYRNTGTIEAIYTYIADKDFLKTDSATIFRNCFSSHYLGKIYGRQSYSNAKNKDSRGRNYRKVLKMIEGYK